MDGFKAIGLSYRNTPIEVREKVALEGVNNTDFLIRLKEMFPVEEAMLVSTCNRTEVYYTSEEDLGEEIISLIASYGEMTSVSLDNYFISYNSLEATKHLFEVSLGLDSQVLGDIQISNQVKKAYQASADLGLAGPHLHRLMHTIFYANKRVVQETTLQDGMASVASVAVDLIEGFISKIAQPRIALIGLGEIGQNVLENLGEHEAQVTLVNRTKSKAELFAEGKEFMVGDLEKLDEIIEENDVIISAVSSKTPLISKINFPADPVHKLLIDLSVPRSIDLSVESVPGVSLYNVDQLSERTQKARAIREKAIPEVKSIIDDAIQGFESWKNELEVSPTIQKLKNALEQIRQDELGRLKNISDQERDLMEVVTKNMIQKVIKLPVLQLKAACKRGEVDTLVDVINELFNLDKEEAKKS